MMIMAMVILKTYLLTKSLFKQSQNHGFFISKKSRLNFKKLSDQKGQLIIEYVLLLSVVTVLAGVFIGQMIGKSDDPASQGLIVRKWSQVVQAIASDVIDN